MKKNMNFLKKAISATFVLACLLGLIPMAVSAASDTPEPPKQDWSFNGIFGTFDRASAQRGLQVYREVCASCHSLRLIHFRQLKGIGYKGDQIKAMAAEIDVEDGPNDDGDMFERKGIPADRFPSPFLKV